MVFSALDASRPADRHGRSVHLWCLLPLALAAGLSSSCDPSPSDPDVLTIVSDDADAGDADGTARPPDTSPSGTPRPRGTDDEACASDQFIGGEFFRGNGICSPRPPRGTPPTECPSGRFAARDDVHGHGLCLPDLGNWNCPDGWNARPAFTDSNGETRRPDELSAFDVCRPPKLSDACPSGQMPSLKSGGCVSRGSACPSGAARWPDTETLRDRAKPVDGDIVYVDATAGSSGDGSRSRPYTTADQALEAATDGDILALAPGTYDTRLELRDKSAAVVGACSAETRLAADFRPIIARAGQRMTVADLSVAGLSVFGDGPNAGRTTHLRGVVIDGGQSAGLHVSGADVSATRLTVRDTAPRRRDGKMGFGIEVKSGGNLTLTESVVADNRAVGVIVYQSDSTARVEHTIVRGTRRQDGDPPLGQGLQVYGGAELTLTASLVEDNRGDGVLAADGDTTFTAAYTMIRGTQAPDGATAAGSGLTVLKGASATADHLVVADNRGLGAQVQQKGSELELTDTVIRDTRPTATSRRRGSGLAVSRGATARLRSAVVWRNHTSGVRVDKSSSQLTVEDSVISATRPHGADDTLGMGAVGFEGGKLVVRRSLLSGNRRAGIQVSDPHTQLTLESALVRDTDAEKSDNAYGVGVIVDEAGATIDRSWLLDNRQIGLWSLRGEAEVDVSDAVVCGTHIADGESRAFGVLSLEGASTTVRRSNICETRGIGAVAAGESTRLQLTETTVRDNRTLSTEREYGYGVHAQAGAALDLKTTALSNNANIGLFVTGGETEATLVDSSVRGTRPRLDVFPSGVGILLWKGHLASAKRLLVAGNAGIGVELSLDATADLRDAAIVETGGRPERAVGDGLMVVRDSEADIDRTSISHNDRLGLLVSRSTVSVSRSRITDNRTGIVREYENDIDMNEVDISRNEAADEECRQQCYEKPPDPGGVEALPGQDDP